MSAHETVRLFVPAESLTDDRLRLDGADAERLYLRGARAGDTVTVLDDSGWEKSVALETVEPDRCRGQIVGRTLATERRTKISLYHGLLHPSDFRRLLSAATARGVVAFVPIITDRSVVPGPQSGLADREQWQRRLRDAAEQSGRGRQPVLHTTMLLGHALEEASRRGQVLLVTPAGVAPEEAIGETRPFSIELFCPPPGGFTDDEHARAVARGVTLLAPPSSAPASDPTRQALTTLDQLYQTLET